MEDASKGGGEWMSWLISQTGSSTRDGKIPKAESGAEQDVGVKWWLVQRHSCTASLGHLKPSAKIRHKPVLRWREKTVWKQGSDCFCFKIPGEINYLYLPPLIISARTDTPMAQWSSAVSWQLTRNEHVFFIFGTYLLFTHRKILPGIFRQAHNLFSCQIWGWNAIPVTAGVHHTSAQTHSQWPMAITFLLIVKQSSASISLRPHRPRRHLCWRLLESNIILGWSGQHKYTITYFPCIHAGSENVAYLLHAPNYI